MAGNKDELFDLDYHVARGIIEQLVVSEVNHLVAVVRMVFVTPDQIVDYLELDVVLPLLFVIIEVVSIDYKVIVLFKINEEDSLDQHRTGRVLMGVSRDDYDVVTAERLLVIEEIY